jgi:putative glycosyltransferase (TIGR04372 family)
LNKLTKHFEQIKRGGTLVVVKKIRSLIYLILQSPIYLISFPIVIIIRLIRPWFLIRWGELTSSRIGHFSINVELYCCEQEAGINVPSQKYLDLFYLKKIICNRQLEKMWRRQLLILPNWLLFPLSKVNIFLNKFISGGNYHMIGFNDIMAICTNNDRDVHNLIEKFQPHISFTKEEEIKGKKILTEFGIPEGAKFVCLLVRDSGYLDRHKKYEYLKRWSYHSYRDGDIDKYVLATEELAKRGYYVFRMGINVLKPLKSSNPKVIDYANSKIRSEFMDIYLGAKCSFGITTGTGFDEIPRIFRKPIVWVYVPLGYIITNNEKDLIITKHHINKKNKNKLTISEIFSSNVAVSLYANEFKKNDIELKENTPEEIRDLVVEMEERLTGCWHETEEDLLLQKKFWSIFKENINQLRLKMPLHGKMKSRFGAKFLRDNQNWIK